MKTTRFLPLLIALNLAATALTLAAEDFPPTPPAADEISGTDARWSAIKGYTYERRDLLLAGLKGLEERVDAQISELAAQRATMDASNTRTKEWDFALQEMSSARTNLLSTSNELGKASRDNWDQLKDKVGLAWVRTQDAVAKVKSSTTK